MFRCLAGLQMNSASTTGFGPTRVAAIPATARTARAVMLVAPSSAVVERMFSVFKCLFGDQQSAALGDFECVATLARCNNNYRQYGQ